MKHDSRQEIEILYIDLRGEMCKYRILPLHIRFGVPSWSGEEQWLLEAIDIDISQERCFALKDIQAYLPTGALAAPF